VSDENNNERPAGAKLTEEERQAKIKAITEARAAAKAAKAAEAAGEAPVEAKPEAPAVEAKPEVPAEVKPEAPAAGPGTKLTEEERQAKIKAVTEARAAAKAAKAAEAAGEAPVEAKPEASAEVKPEAPAAGSGTKLTEEERQAKIKAVAEARAAAKAAKAAEGAEAPGEAKPEASAGGGNRLTEEERQAKIKAVAEARAAKAAAQAGGGEAPAGDADKEAKAKAAAEARAARAAARAGDAPAADAGPKEPSPNQPRLDRIVALIKQHVAADAVVEAVINERDRHIPVITVANDHWPAVAQFVKDSEELDLGYLYNVSGVDYESYMETVYYVLSLKINQNYCFKVKTNRETPSINSVTPIWATANWNEREVFDLLGIDFPGHPDLRRIMMPDDWVGYPLRKDYVPIDPEV
jgi:NADH-quinone oxidoreductase subunit C